MLPSAAELEYFIEIANALNISRAAERLGISQPSLSLALKRLEQTVGAELLARHKHGVTLTQAGKQLLLHTRQLLQDWNNTKSKALASLQEVQGNFILGCNATIALFMVAEFLPELLEEHPRLDIRLKHDISMRITEQVISLSIDIGIVTNPIKHPDLIIIKLGADETCFWTGVGNREIQVAHSENAVVVCNPDTIQAQSLLQQCKKKGFTFNRMVTTENLEVVAHLCAKGSGIGIIPTRVAKALYPHQLKRIPKMPAYSDELCLIYRNENRNIKAIQAIVNAIKVFNKKIN